MAVTRYASGDALTQKLWARDLMQEVRKGLEIAPLIGTGKNSIIHEKTDFVKKGDNLTYGLRMQLTGDGKTEGEKLEGNEESLTTYNDSLVINELRHAVRIEGEDTISAQRVLFNMRTEARDGLKDWFADRMSLSFFVQLAGYTAPTMTYRDRTITMSSVYRGLNSVAAPTSGRHVWADDTDPSANTADENIAAADKMTLDYIPILKEKARTANPKIRPVRVNGSDKYVLYLHPYQVTDLKLSAQASGSISWADIQLAAMQGGKISGNPIYTGALGEYDGVIFRESEDVTTGVHASTGAEISTVRRALFLGAQAGAIGFSSKFQKNSPFKWAEEEFDYGHEMGIAATGLFGIKKCQFNSQDFGALVLSTYAAAHG